MRAYYWLQRTRDAVLRWLLEHTSAGRFVLYEQWRRGWQQGYDEGREETS